VDHLAGVVHGHRGTGYAIRLRENNYLTLVYAWREIEGETGLACVTEALLRRS